MASVLGIAKDSLVELAEKIIASVDVADRVNPATGGDTAERLFLHPSLYSLQPQAVAHAAPDIYCERPALSPSISLSPTLPLGALSPPRPLSRRRHRHHRIVFPMVEPAILVETLTKRYDGVLAVDGIDFAIEAGTIAALLGGNGAGKTTTIAMLLGLLLPTSGTVRVWGSDMARDRYRVLPRINFSSPYVDMPRRLTVAENLRVYAMLYGVANARRKIAEIAEAMDITPFLDRRLGSLSAGQKTRVALAKALINDPELLLLDEPTASLDPDTADWVRRYFLDYHAATGATLLIASHNMGEVERLCTDVIMMRTGRIVDRGAPQALIERYGRQTLEEVFLDIARGGDGDRPRVAS
jgi:ABC-2 type transport system ATP-binding protein